MSLNFSWISLSSLFLLAFSFLYIVYSRKKQRNYPPGPWRLPIFGSIFSIGENPVYTFQEWGKKFGPIIYTKFGLTNVLILDDPKAIREAFAIPAFNGRIDNKIFNILPDGKFGIIGTAGAEWTEQRRFVHKCLRDFGVGKKSIEGLITDELNDFIEWLHENEGQQIVVNRKFTLATLNIIWTVVTSQKLNHDDPKLTFIVDTGFKLFNDISKSGLLFFIPELIDILPKFMNKAWYELLKYEGPTRKIFADPVEEHLQNPVNDDSPRDLIDVYLAKIKSTTNPSSTFYEDVGRKSLLAVISDLYGAALGTTSSTLSFSMLYLMTHAQVQQKVHAELDDVIGRNRKPSLADKSMLPYTEAVMWETLRKSSLFPNGIFHSTMEDTSLRGYHIPKGTTIIPNFYSVHNSALIWGDPEKFRPERFLTPDGKKLVRNENLMPFGYGKRQCLGESLAVDTFFLFLTSILQRFQIEPNSADPPPNLEPEFQFINQTKPFRPIFKLR